MGMNLTIECIGISLCIFDKIFGVLAEKSSFSLIAVWFPNFVFGILAIFLLRNAKR
jgi:lipopolysaccharide export system permease protein